MISLGPSDKQVVNCLDMKPGSEFIEPFDWKSLTISLDFDKEIFKDRLLGDCSSHKLSNDCGVTMTKASNASGWISIPTSFSGRYDLGHKYFSLTIDKFICDDWKDSSEMQFTDVDKQPKKAKKAHKTEDFDDILEATFPEE